MHIWSTKSDLPDDGIPVTVINCDVYVENILSKFSKPTWKPGLKPLCTKSSKSASISLRVDTPSNGTWVVDFNGNKDPNDFFCSMFY